MHIHVLTKDCTEAHYAKFQSNAFGSRFFRQKSVSDVDYEECSGLVANTPCVWVGEVSWLKAGLFGDDSYIPPTVLGVSEAISENFPVIDNALIERISAAFDMPNETGYGLAKREDVVAFLEAHRGEKAFTVSW